MLFSDMFEKETSVEPREVSLEIREDSVFEQTITQRFLEMIARLNIEYIDRLLTYNAGKENVES